MNKYLGKAIFNSLLKMLLISCFTAIYSVNNANAQTWSWDYFLEQMTAEEENEYTAWNYLYEELCELHEHPFNINKITKEQLEQFPFLNAAQIENILAYLYSYGPMQTLGELQLIGEMDFETRQLLSLFVYVDAEEKKRTVSLKNVLRYGKHEVITRADIPLYERAGYKEYSDSILQRYPNRKYVGDPYYHSLRYQFSYGNKVYAGLVAEKDPGEAFFASGKKGYDFYSYYFMLKDIGRLKALVVGNYRLNFGQGLVMNTNFSLGKTAAISSIGSLNKGIRKHSSTSEDNFFRGVAAAFRIGEHFTLTGFYSNKKQDATLKQDSTVMIEPFITSFKTDGYHRTPLEISKKNNVSNELFGSNLSYSNKGFRVGLTGVYNVFNRVLKPSDEPYKKYAARGKEFYAYGADYSYFHHRFTLAGETAYCKGGGIATLNSIQFQLTRDYKFILIQRYYSKEYNALYANSFAESSSVQNESGIYLGMEATPLRHLKLNGYFDVFRFPYLRYQASVPSSRGVDGMLQALWTPGKKSSLMVKYRYKNKGKDFTLKDSNRKGIDVEIQQKLCVQWQYKPINSLMLKTTFDYAQVDFIEQESDCGYMFTQNVEYASASFPLSADLSMAYFHTDSYASRLYRYEKGMLYAFSFPSFYYEGTRLALRLRYEPNNRFMFIAKYGNTRYLDRESIGSSQQKIEGNMKQDIQLQVRMKF